MMDRIISCLVALTLAMLVWLYARSRDQAILDKVIGSHRVARQCSGIAPQPWDFGLEPLSKFAHRYHIRGSSPGLAEAARSTQNKLVL